MAEAQAPPTLASLRRSAGVRSRPALPRNAPEPSLFDLLPPNDEVASEPLAEACSTPPVPPAVTLPASATVPSAAPEPVESRDAVPPVQAVPAPVAPPIWTVSRLVRHVRGLVEGGYSRVTVEGEISNWRPAGSGHCYFTLKDADAQLPVVLFRRQASLLRFRPQDGDAVKVHGQLSIYESRGQLQLIAEWMQQAGLGALLAAVQLLKEKLRAEGLFNRKRPLPPFPRCIGVITSLHGAALRDIVKVCRRRHAAVQLLVYPAAVQGPNCPAEIAAGLRWFNAHPDHAEVVLVARGGGSWEDLHGFNHEQVVRAIAASVLPVITGVGHATDSTLADAAADQCAPTPSAAAELLTSAQYRVEERIHRLEGRLVRAGRFEFLRAEQRLARLSAPVVLRRVRDALNRRSQRVDEAEHRLGSALQRRFRVLFNQLRVLESRLGRVNPAAQLQTGGRRLEALRSRLERAIALRIGERHRRYGAGHARLSALSPLRVLERGYALIYKNGGTLLRDAGEVEPGERITARLGRGTLEADVVDRR